MDEKDKRRQGELGKLGLSFLRFDDLEVKFRMDEVLKRIKDWIAEHEKLTTP